MKMREINEKGQKSDKKIGHRVLLRTWLTDSSEDVEFFKREIIKSNRVF